MARRVERLALALALFLVAGASGCSCIGGKAIPRPYPEPAAQAILDHLAGARAAATSFQAESVMDYWVGDDRVKGTVLIMGRVGAHLRINALNPTGDNVAADLACDGSWFQYIDYNNNCQLTGPCNRDSVAQLLRVSLDPDDFLLLAVGTTPVIPGPHESTLRWDDGKGHEILSLKAPDGTRQTIVLDGREQRWDVLSSTVQSPAGKTLWRLQNKDFRVHAARPLRVPGKTRFTQPQDKADLLVRWVERTLGPNLPDDKFRMTIPAGLPRCR